VPHLTIPPPGELLFWLFAVTACLMGLLVILLQNPVSSALALVMTLCSLAGLFLTLGAQFIAAVQVIVYAGAIMVLFLFVIMLLQLRAEPGGERTPFGPRVMGGAIGIALIAELGSVVATAVYRTGAANPEFDSPLNTQAIGRALFSRFLLPFEVTSLLLLIALLGAVVLAKRKF
jgi:NADH-quinone oxidoreductase subunit J